MQERKYRGLSYETNTFVYGWLHQTKYESSKYFIRTFPNEDDDYVDVVVDKNTIGQEIGLKDKYGVEIFDGDILKASGYPAIEVIYDNNTCSFKMKVQYIGWYDLLILSPNKTPHLEVIGNIHENPELLEGK